MGLLKKILRHLAKRVLARYNPKIVAVTGSVGKTSTVRAVATVLARHFRVRSTPKNFNNEIGVPLSILGEEKSGGHSPIAWARIFMRGFMLAYGPKRLFPQILVLEMGADHPGDISYLTEIAPPDVAVVTAVSEAHTEYFGTLEAVALEKGSLIEALKPGGTAVVNADDAYTTAMDRHSSEAQILRYGFADTADFQGRDVRYEGAMGTYFTRFTFKRDEKNIEIVLAEALGRGNVLAALAATAVASALKMPSALIPYGLGEYHPPAGRLRVIPGIRQTVIIDDTYNASPRAADIALDVIFNLAPPAGGRRILVMGDMLELGKMTEEKHRELGRAIAHHQPGILIGVGPFASFICEEAVHAGMSVDKVFHMENAETAGRFLQDRIHRGDLILIKGSQGIRLEKAVKELMADPKRAEELLVRQGKSWKS